MAKKKKAKKKKAKKNNKTSGVTQSVRDIPVTVPYEVMIAVIDSLAPDATKENVDRRDNLLRECLEKLYEKHTISNQYNVLIFHDEGTMLRSDIDRIYSEITDFTKQLPILLILNSSGGDVDSGYLIGKICREYCKDKFIVVIPRRAKSSATLLCCAADELHMGSLSEMGPIDPQVNYMPALGLKDSIETFAELVKEHPAASDMFAKYLHLSLKPMHLGYCERVAESASQYAQRLLETHKKNIIKPIEEIAKRLVYDYKDHGFVIDKAEAKTIFGEKIVKEKTPEYKFGDAIYETLWRIGDVADRMKKRFCLIGTKSTRPVFWNKPKKQL